MRWAMTGVVDDAVAVVTVENTSDEDTGDGTHHSSRRSRLDDCYRTITACHNRLRYRNVTAYLISGGIRVPL